MVNRTLRILLLVAALLAAIGLSQTAMTGACNGANGTAGYDLPC